jgi:hypothetical protein
MASRARIQLMLPRRVLISPLWAMRWYGWASSQLGNVLVLNREWKRHSALSVRGSSRSAKYSRNCGGVSMPL